MSKILKLKPFYSEKVWGYENWNLSTHKNGHSTVEESEKTLLETINKELPILLLSGTHDPVGDMSKGVKKVYDDMLKAGFKNVKLELLDKARHDILHETHVSFKVYSLIKDFINE